MTRRTISATLGMVLAMILLAACGGSSSSVAPSVAGQASSAPETTAPTTAPASEAPSAGASIAIPSFELPSDDKALEALLPSTLCGKAATKLSFSGARFAGVSDPTFTSTLAQLGKSPADVAFAVSSPGVAALGTCKQGAIVFQIKGADPGRFRDVFIAAAQKQNDTTYTQSNVGGKDVYIGTSKSDGTKTYAYFKGDALFIVEAPDEATAAPLLQEMP